MALNVRLLRRVKKAILKEPSQFVMGDWFVCDGTEGRHDIERKIKNCGTAACIAGWTVALTVKKNPKEAREAAALDGGVVRIAANSLGLGPDWDNLFYIDCWPEKFQRQWYKAKTLKGRASIAARRIEDYIEDNRGKK